MPPRLTVGDIIAEHRRSYPAGWRWSTANTA